MPTVSVVVPCYKYGRYVTDCVTSVLANSEVDLDILVDKTLAGSLKGVEIKKAIVNWRPDYWRI